MKLKDFLLNGVFNDEPTIKQFLNLTSPVPQGLGIDNYSISGKQLYIIKDALQQCDEFQDCELIILDKPAIEDNVGKPYLTQTMKLAEDTTFKHKVFLYGLSLTPEIYNPNQLNTPVHEGCSIGPVT